MRVSSLKDGVLTMGGNHVPTDPALDGRVATVAQLVGHRSNASEGVDYVSRIHLHNVRFKRTSVNVENVHRVCADAGMATIGEQLIALKARSKLSMDQIAKRSGYAGRSSVQSFFQPHYNPAALDASVATKLASGLVGLGEPPIELLDILNLVAPTLAQVPTIDIPSAETLQIVLVEILDYVAGLEIPESKARLSAITLELCIQLLSANPAIHANRDAIRAVVHATSAPFLGARPKA